MFRLIKSEQLPWYPEPTRLLTAIFSSFNTLYKLVAEHLKIYQPNLAYLNKTLFFIIYKLSQRFYHQFAIDKSIIHYFGTNVWL